MLLSSAASPVAIPLARPAIAKLSWRPGGGGPTVPANSSIGTATGRTFVRWEDWLSAVTALGKIRISDYPTGVTGTGYPDSEFNPPALVIGNIDTSDFTGSSAFAITMTAAPGAGVQRGVPLAYNGNAATYNPANGVCLKFTLVPGSYPFDGGIVVNRLAATTSSNILIKGLQLKLIAGNRVIDTDNNLLSTDTSRVVVSQCILESSFGSGVFSGFHSKHYNCLFLFRGEQDTGFCPHAGIFDGPAGGGAFFYGCTVVSPSDNTAGLPTGSPPDNAWCTSEGGSTTTWSNCAFFGWQQVSNSSGGSPGGAYTKCATNSAAITTDYYCQPPIANFTGTITTNTTLTVSGVTGSPIAIGQWLQGAGIINGTRQITGGSGTVWTVTSGANIASEAMNTFLPTTPNTGSGVTAGVTYNSTSPFTGTTGATADFRLPSGSPLILAGTADPTNLSVDISGFPRPLSGSIDIGCYEFT